MEPYDALDGAITSTAGIVKNVSRDQFAAPTPCIEWDVHDLLNHLIGTLWLAEALLTDRPPRHPVGPGSVPPLDLVGDDPAAAYAEAAAVALAAARSGDALTRGHATPLGEMPGAALAGAMTLDVAVHGWDLAKATGQPAGIDDDLAAHLLGFAQQAVTDDIRAPRIGPAVPIAPDAPLIDRLVAHMGRRPSWVRGGS